MENAKWVLRKSIKVKNVIVDSSACTVDFVVNSTGENGYYFRQELTHHALYKMLEAATVAEILPGGKDGFVKFNQGAVMFIAYEREVL